MGLSKNFFDFLLQNQNRELKGPPDKLQRKFKYFFIKYLLA